MKHKANITFLQKIIWFQQIMEYTSFKNVCNTKIYFKAGISKNSKNIYKGNRGSSITLNYMTNLQLQCNDPPVCLCPFSYRNQMSCAERSEVWCLDCDYLRTRSPTWARNWSTQSLSCRECSRLMTAFVVSSLLLVDKHSSVEPTYQCLYFAIHCFLKNSKIPQPEVFEGTPFLKKHRWNLA